MMHLLQLFRAKPLAEPDLDPEVAMIMRELDEELARDHELLDDIGYASRNVGDLLRGFAQRCHKVALVGSHRRGKQDPGDLDVLYVPKGNLQVIEFLEQAADDEKGITRNDKVWSCAINGTPVDFIESSEKDWGMDLVHFTGSRAFSERVLRHVERRGYRIQKGRPVVSKDDGYSSWSADAFAGWSEEKILTHLGLEAFLDPHKRELA